MVRDQHGHRSEMRVISRRLRQIEMLSPAGVRVGGQVQMGQLGEATYSVQMTSDGNLEPDVGKRDAMVKYEPGE